MGGALPQRPARKSAEGEEESEGPPLLLAESWDNAADLAGWWMSEKLDGVRAYWDGRQFLSRQGNLYHAPDWFIEGLPAVTAKMVCPACGHVHDWNKADAWLAHSSEQYGLRGLTR